VSCKEVRLRGGASLLSVTANERSVLHWDDGEGPLWGYWVAAGHFGYLRGVVVAETWEDAYSCCEDEIMEDPDPDLVSEFEEAWVSAEQAGQCGPDFPEGMGMRSSGVPSNGGMETHYCWDEPMGSILRPLTVADVQELGLRLRVRRV
jgi:hypothetical protein